MTTLQIVIELSFVGIFLGLLTVLCIAVQLDTDIASIVLSLAGVSYILTLFARPDANDMTDKHLRP